MAMLSVRKVYFLDTDLAQAIEDYRFSGRFLSEGAAARDLLQRGLETLGDVIYPHEDPAFEKEIEAAEKGE